MMMMATEIEYIITRPEAVEPRRMHHDDSAWDVFAAESTTIKPGEVKKIDIGLRMKYSPDYRMLLTSRSGMACNDSIEVAGSPTIIDCNYRGNVMVPLRNLSQKPYKVNVHDRIAQMIIEPFVSICFTQYADHLKFNSFKTERGAEGFGSTGR